jgi:hypothetical protein
VVRFRTGATAGGSKGHPEKAEKPGEVIRSSWAQARYDLRLKEQEFWLMTPRQFHLLWERHREEMIHREMIQAFTTAAVINFSLCRPDEAVAPKDFMPNFQLSKAKEPEAETLTNEEMADYRSKRAHIVALLKKYQATGKADPYLVKIGLVTNA